MLQHTVLLAVNRMIFKNRKIRDPRESLFASINHAKFNIMTISEGKRYVA